MHALLGSSPVSALASRRHSTFFPEVLFFFFFEFFESTASVDDFVLSILKFWLEQILLPQLRPKVCQSGQTYQRNAPAS